LDRSSGHEQFIHPIRYQDAVERVLKFLRHPPLCPLTMAAACLVFAWYQQ
jgi:hypothetical protein